MSDSGPGTEPQEWNRGRPHRRRVARKRERGPLAVLAAIPHGRTRPRRVSTWREEALAHPATTRLTARSWRSWRAYVQAISNAIDVGSMTTRFSWDSLAAAVVEIDPRAAASRASTARYLRMLREAGLLAVVASGRQGRYAPASNEGANDAAVYVLCVRRHLLAVDELDAGEDAGDQFETPPLERVENAPYTRARGHSRNAQTEPLRGTAPSRAAQARPSTHLERASERLWPAGQATNGKDDRIAAARTLCHLLPVVRSLSHRDIASVLRPFLLAGWTVRDVMHAVDRQPNGRAWPHSGAHGVRGARGWLKHRLGAWRDQHGTVLRSPSQRSQDEKIAALARLRAQRERAARQAAAAADPLHSPAAAAAIAEARAVLEAARRRARYRSPAAGTGTPAREGANVGRGPAAPRASHGTP